MTPTSPQTRVQRRRHTVSQVVEADGATHLLNVGGPSERPLLHERGN